VQFSFTEDQRLFADTVRDLLTDQCPPSRVRAAWDGATDRALWSQLGEMGVLALMAPESAGGMGMSELDLVLLLVETGRCAMPDPVVDTAAVAVPMLAAAEHPALGPVAGGEVAVSVGFADDPLVRVDADQLLLQRDDAWHLVPLDAVSASPEQSVDGARRLATIEWDPTPDTLVTDDPAATALAFDRAVLGISAQLLGLADHLLAVTVEYVQEREQFGRPIGSYQALKHKLADVLMALDFARPMVARAAYSLATDDPSARVHVSMAKAYASQAGLTAASHALQCHGAIAYTVEYDLHMWMKRVWALAAQWGDAAWHRRRVGEAIL
jgi:hypothetical protein